MPQSNNTSRSRREYEQDFSFSTAVLRTDSTHQSLSTVGEARPGHYSAAAQTFLNYYEHEHVKIVHLLG